MAADDETGTLFERSLRWLQHGLQLRTPNMPRRLAADMIVGVIDVMQNGAATDDWRESVSTQGAGNVSQQFVLFTNAVSEASLVFNLRIDHAGGAGAAISEFFRRRPTTALLAHHVLRRSTPAATNDTHADVLGAADRLIYVPPDYEFRVTAPATVAGESLDYVVLRLVVPAGTKAW